MVFKRDLYLQRLIDGLDSGLIKIITGIRRAGKSYLMNDIFYNYLLNQGTKKSTIIKFAFDSAGDLEKIGVNIYELVEQKKKVPYNKFIKYIDKKTSGNNKYYLLLDEIQNLEAFEFVLNGYMNKGNYDIYVTGSNSKFLSKDVITEFRGRGEEIHILPLSFSEYRSGINDDLEIAWDNYITYGGLPIVQSMKTDEMKISYLKNVCKELYFKDILDHNKIYNSDILPEVFDIISSYLSRELNPLKLSNVFKSETNKVVDDETIDKYIGFFEDAFLISKVIRYDIKGKKYIKTPYKIYFEDLGVRNARLNFRQIDESYLMENVIYNELRYRGYVVDTGSVIVNEPTDRKDCNGKIVYIRKEYEVDFVASKGNKKYYIQSALSINDDNKLKQESNSIMNIHDSFKKIIIVKDRIKPRIDESGIETISLYDFLLKDYLS